MFFKSSINYLPPLPLSNKVIRICSSDPFWLVTVIFTTTYASKTGLDLFNTWAYIAKGWWWSRLIISDEVSEFVHNLMEMSSSPYRGREVNLTALRWLLDPPGYHSIMYSHLVPSSVGWNWVMPFFETL